MNRKYVGGITYLPVSGARPLYLATVIDLCSRRLAGWAIADHMRTELVIDALAAAEQTRGTLTGAIMHTDRGSQYTSRSFAEICRSAGVRQSMGAIGSSADNAAAESFNADFKRETLKGRKGWSSEGEARLDAFRWLTRTTPAAGTPASASEPRSVTNSKKLILHSVDWGDSAGSPAPGFQIACLRGARGPAAADRTSRFRSWAC
ncbi:DDE-type integrase/transposase/recombinase [Streptomyces parvus]|nr:DDE-type integrase/transposase/recombinase [Streptomyces parvus]MCQ1578487.1 DDE-type integrase/transposase/recombinase [Streptomyces parvus]